MIGYDRLQRAFEAYSEADTTSFAAQMGGFDPAELLRFSADATAEVAEKLRLNRDQRTTLAGTLACGVLLGAALVRQGASA